MQAQEKTGGRLVAASYLVIQVVLGAGVPSVRYVSMCAGDPRDPNQIEGVVKIRSQH